MWFTWGDLGFTEVKTIRMRIAVILFILFQKIGVFVDHDSYAESFNLQCQFIRSSNVLLSML